MQAVVRQAADGVVAHRKAEREGSCATVSSRSGSHFPFNGFTHTVVRIAGQLGRIGRTGRDPRQLNTNLALLRTGIGTYMLVPSCHAHDNLLIGRLGTIGDAVVVQVRTCVEAIYISSINDTCQ